MVHPYYWVRIYAWLIHLRHSTIHACKYSKCQTNAYPRGEGPDAQAPSADCSGADLMGEAAVCSTAALRSAMSSAVRESSASSNRLRTCHPIPSPTCRETSPPWPR